MARKKGSANPLPDSAEFGDDADDIPSESSAAASHGGHMADCPRLASGLALLMQEILERYNDFHGPPHL